MEEAEENKYKDLSEEEIGKLNSINEFQEYDDDFRFSSEDLSKSILDVGASSGDFVRFLREEVGNKNAFGVELHPMWLPKDPSGMIIANGLKLPFADESFEIVTARNFVSMFDRKRMSITLLRELLRVTKHGGKVMFTTITPEQLRKENNAYMKEKEVSVLAKMKIIFFEDLKGLEKEGFLMEIYAVNDHRTTVKITKP